MVLNGGPISWKASVVRQTLDKDAKELGKSKETLQKVRNSLDQLRVALLLKDPVCSLDGSGKVLPSSWISAQHHQVRACLVVGDVENVCAHQRAGRRDRRTESSVSPSPERVRRRAKSTQHLQSWRVLYSRSYFGPRTCGGGITNVIEVGGSLNQCFPISPLMPHFRGLRDGLEYKFLDCIRDSHQLRNRNGDPESQWRSVMVRVLLRLLY